MIDLSLADDYNSERNRTSWEELSQEERSGFLVEAETEIEYHPAYNIPDSEKTSKRYVAVVTELAYHRFGMKDLPGSNVKRVKNNHYEEEFFEQKNSIENEMSWPVIVLSMLKPWSIQVSLRLSTMRCE